MTARQVRGEGAAAAAADELSRRYRRATDVIEEVQRALLPARLPVLPGVDLAASYSVGGSSRPPAATGSTSCRYLAAPSPRSSGTASTPPR